MTYVQSKVFWRYSFIKDVEEEINKFLKENDVIPMSITHANCYYVLLYMEKGEYLSLCFMKHEDNELYFTFNNNYNHEDINKPLDCTKFEKEKR